MFIDLIVVAGFVDMKREMFGVNTSYTVDFSNG